MASTEDGQNLNGVGMEVEERVRKHHRASILVNWDPKYEEDFARQSRLESVPDGGKSV